MIEGGPEQQMMDGANGRYVVCERVPKEQPDAEGGVFGVLDTATNEWVVYPKPRGMLYRWRRRAFRKGNA